MVEHVVDAIQECQHAERYEMLPAQFLVLFIRVLSPSLALMQNPLATEKIGERNCKRLLNFASTPVSNYSTVFLSLKRSCSQGDGSITGPTLISTF